MGFPFAAATEAPLLLTSMADKHILPFGFHGPPLISAKQFSNSSLCTHGSGWNQLTPGLKPSVPLVLECSGGRVVLDILYNNYGS